MWPFLKDILQNDLNLTRYQRQREGSGFLASELGDAIVIVALEDFLVVAKEKWRFRSPGQSYEQKFQKTSKGDMHTLTNKLKDQDFLAQAADFLGITDLARSFHPHQPEFLRNMHEKANVLEKCLYFVLHELGSARQSMNPWSHKEHECYDLFFHDRCLSCLLWHPSA